MRWEALLRVLEEQMAGQCNVMFCILDTHEGDRHVDPTGYGWNEPTPDRPVIAHAIDGAGNRTRLFADGESTDD